MTNREKLKAIRKVQDYQVQITGLLEEIMKPSDVPETIYRGEIE